MSFLLTKYLVVKIIYYLPMHICFNFQSFCELRMQKKMIDW